MLECTDDIFFHAKFQLNRYIDLDLFSPTRGKNCAFYQILKSGAPLPTAFAKAKFNIHGELVSANFTRIGSV